MNGFYSRFPFSYRSFCHDFKFCNVLSEEAVENPINLVTLKALPKADGQQTALQNEKDHFLT